MSTDDALTPRPEHRFTFGLWTVGNPGRDPFGAPTREPVDPVDSVHKLAELGAWGITPARRGPRPLRRARAERDKIVGRFKAALEETGLGVGMATTNLFGHPGVQGRRLHVERPRRAAGGDRQGHALDRPRGRAGWRAVRLLGRPRGHRGRRWPRTRATRSSATARPSTCSATTSWSRATTCASRWSPSPTSRAATSSCPPSATPCTSSPRSRGPTWSASTPRWRTRRWPASPSCTASARRCGRGSSSTSTSTARIGRYDQDFRFGAEDLKEAFLLVRLLERAGYDGPAPLRRARRTATRTPRASGTSPRAACAPTSRWPSGRAASTSCPRCRRRSPPPRPRSWARRPSPATTADALKAEADGLDALAARGYGNERLDQLLVEVLMGAR